MNKPIWHTGTWTQRQSLALQDELLAAQLHRSLTPEERAWLLSIDTPETFLEAEQ